jgi:hypothetical protein
MEKKADCGEQHRINEIYKSQLIMHDIMVTCETSWRSVDNSLWMRGALQSALLALIVLIRPRIRLETHGRP